MAKQRTTRGSAATGRGSKEAIEKRRAARQLNALAAGGTNGRAKVDGRTEKRRRRLIAELKEGRDGEPLKPIDVVTHVDELLRLGESLPSIKKQGVRPRKTDLDDDVRETVRRTQEAYGFRTDAWKMLGLYVGADGEVTDRRPTRKKASKKKA